MTADADNERRPATQHFSTLSSANEEGSGGKVPYTTVGGELRAQLTEVEQKLGSVGKQLEEVVTLVFSVI